MLAGHVHREGEMEYDRKPLDEQVEWLLFKAVEFIHWRSPQRPTTDSHLIL